VTFATCAAMKLGCNEKKHVYQMVFNLGLLVEFKSFYKLNPVSQLALLKNVLNCLTLFGPILRLHGSLIQASVCSLGWGSLESPKGERNKKGKQFCAVS
jgi:hypothetical protein